MKPLALAGAAAAAAVGAGLWAAVAYFMELELGWLAWGIGGLVGGAALALGGRGPASGGLAAALTIASILGGKALAIDLVVGQVTEDEYHELMEDAAAYPGPTDREALGEFVVDHGFTLSDSPEEIAQFLEFWGPYLERWKADRPSYEEWQPRESARRKEFFYSEFGLVETIKEDLGFIDIVFFILGVSTAFKLAGRPDEDFAPAPLETDEGPPPPSDGSAS